MESVTQLKYQKPSEVVLASHGALGALDLSIYSEVIRPWFQKLSIPAIRAIPASQRGNMDETGIMEGHGLNGCIVGGAETRTV